MNGRINSCWQLAGCSIIVCFLLAQSVNGQLVPTRTIKGQIEVVPSEPTINPPVVTNEFDVAQTQLTQTQLTQSQLTQSKSTQSTESQKLSEIDLTASPGLRTPRLIPTPEKTTTFEPPAIGTLYQWESSTDIHRSVLFEDPQLERYGCTRNARLQPAISGLKFFKDGALFPAQLILRRHR